MKHIHAFGVRAKISCIDFLYAWCYNQEARISVVKFCLAGGYGGIGRRDRFRFYCQKTCRFKSCYPHQKVLTPTFTPNFDKRLDIDDTKGLSH